MDEDKVMMVVLEQIIDGTDEEDEWVRNAPVHKIVVSDEKDLDDENVSPPFE